MIERVARSLFFALVVGLSVAAAINIYAGKRFAGIDPQVLGALAALGTGALYTAILMLRRRTRHLEKHDDQVVHLAANQQAYISALEVARGRGRDVVETQGDVILRRTPSGHITYANEAFYKVFGGSPQDTIGQIVRPELHPDTPSPFFGRLTGREFGKERVSYDQHVKTLAGYRWLAWEDYAIRDDHGGLVEIQSVGHDITNRKRIEAALTEARDKAEEASRAKSRFLATMSHEIRTPMNGVLGMARLLLETRLAADQKTYVEAIRQSGLALLSLIEDILDFSKIESGALVLETEEVALRPLVEGVAELLSTRAHAKGIDIATAISSDVPHIVRADLIRLRQVLTNLVGNAIKFTEEGGVLISAEVDRTHTATLKLSVRDTGIGVPPDKRQTIFDDFVQADTSHARQGTGLGLSISKRLVEAMGGTIGVVPAIGRGSIFWTRLPLEDVAAPTADRPLAGKCVALVSASPILHEGLKLQLHAAGATMVEGITADLPACDVVLIDAANLTGEPVFRLGRLGVPAVALLPPGERGGFNGLLGSGVRAYLTKPVRQDSLEKRLAAVIAGEEIAPETETPAAETRPHLSGQPLSVLLAEDNPVNALLAREFLRRRGHVVEEVTTGAAAVVSCAAKRFDLVVMDLHMPGLDGIEATRRIRVAEAAQGKKPVPIFALTADALEEGRKACIEAGMDGFLTKPIDPAELDAILATLAPPAMLKAQ